ncbi:hypothetical protein DPMN_173201 [Dreissena polymorpha]|uniref:Uncharacterized protein n=1 Tax=Dreissena polymorpha TaxID=45954 RepID=A0A9D4E501_DREPO|nr:hypothetical protein DPMN_173201 [Dreissena polymorpha]
MDQFGHFNRLMPELRQEDPASFQNFLRVPPEMFDEASTPHFQARYKLQKSYRSGNKIGSNPTPSGDWRSVCQHEV